MKKPNKELRKAMRDARSGKTLKSESVKELLANILIESNKTAEKALIKAIKTLDDFLFKDKN